jgi:hypothetical protein
MGQLKAGSKKVSQLVHLLNEKDVAFNNLVKIADTVCKRLNSLGEDHEFWRNGEYNKFISDWAMIDHMQQTQLDKTQTEIKLLAESKQESGYPTSKDLTNAQDTGDKKSPR